MPLRTLAVLLLLAACAPWAAAAGAIHHFVIWQDAPVILDRGRYMLHIGQTRTFRARAVDANGYSVSPQPAPSQVRWSIDAGGVGRVDAYGRYTGDRFGIATLRVSLIADPRITSSVPVGAYNQILTTFEVHAEGEANVIYSMPDGSVALDTSRRHTFHADDPRDQYGVPILAAFSTITWSLSPAGIASIDANGTVTTGSATGPVSVVATTGGVRSTLAATVYAPRLADVILFPFEVSVRGGETQVLTPTARDQAQRPLRTQPRFTWSATPAALGTVDAAGAFRSAAADGVARVVASAGGISSAPSAVTVVVPSATFAGIDTTTQGDWYVPGATVYGRDGANIPTRYHRFPFHDYLDPTRGWSSTFYAIYDVTHIVDRGWVAERRALRDPESSSGPRRLVYTESYAPFTFPMEFEDPGWHRVSFYLVDWDRLGARHRIEILDPRGNRVLDSRTFSGFGEGIYARWNIKGKVAIRVTPLTAVPASIYGIFYDPYSAGG